MPQQRHVAVGKEHDRSPRMWSGVPEAIYLPGQREEVIVIQQDCIDH